MPVRPFSFIELGSGMELAQGTRQLLNSGRWRRRRRTRRGNTRGRVHARTAPKTPKKTTEDTTGVSKKGERSQRLHHESQKLGERLNSSEGLLKSVEFFPDRIRVFYMHHGSVVYEPKANKRSDSKLSPKSE